MAIVYITQLPHRRDPTTGALVPAFNVMTANEFGTPHVLMPPQAPYTTVEFLMAQLRTALLHYDFAAGDSLLGLGDPVITAAAISILAVRGKFALLKWERNLGRYLRVVLYP